MAEIFGKFLLKIIELKIKQKNLPVKFFFQIVGRYLRCFWIFSIKTRIFYLRIFRTPKYGPIDT